MSHIYPPFDLLTLFRKGNFGAAQECGSKKASLPKICHTDLPITKLVLPYLKIQKIYKSLGTPLEFYRRQQFFHQKSATFIKSRNTDKDYILMHNFYFF